MTTGRINQGAIEIYLLNPGDRHKVSGSVFVLAQNDCFSHKGSWYARDPQSRVPR